MHDSRSLEEINMISLKSSLFAGFYFFFSLVWLVSSIAKAEPFPSVPAGGQWFDPTGKPITAADFTQVKSMRFSVQSPLRVPLQDVKAGVYRAPQCHSDSALCAWPWNPL